MSRVRTTRSMGGWLALFALTLQLALSFGHVHAHDLLPEPGAITAQGDSHTPADTPAGLPDGDCDICATLYLAGSLVLPTPAVLCTPVAVAAAWLPLRGVLLPPSRRADTCARDPPRV